MKIVVTPPFTEEQKKQIMEASGPYQPVFRLKSDITEELLSDTDVILGNLDDPSQVRWAQKLKWIQLNNAGTEGYCEPGLLPEGAVLTNATGAYGLAISEHMIACLFMLRKKLNLYYADQLRREWKKEGNVGVIQGTTVLVIGLGDIGRTFARKMKALGCYTIGIRRRVSEKTAPQEAAADEIHGLEDLDRLLPAADVVALSLPGNASTYHILNRERIGLLSTNAVVLNVGRGTAVDTDALSDALYAGKIAGAALDVTDPEPLPADHPLWNAPGALITPHVSGGYSLPETLAQICDIFAENLERFRKGEPLKNVVDMETGYCV
ncbi:MAG TPA: D-2-hydroxyacid dehydrogenase [Candidatus Eisenbergiella merdipullorum]|uniref:D-2-hydroxyacid dehydrogenase n=1 Tax=Candidatus Eisenbergiella merdipullorum TaxID=2838553 RepID=A0A9D2I9G6_9FIRM|nr:D-2-hydroxyacid dehydrogenase [Candidatus Eisenbergiella merdipullorum]